MQRKSVFALALALIVLTAVFVPVFSGTAVPPQIDSPLATAVFYPSDDAPARQGVPDTTGATELLLGAGYDNGALYGSTGLVRSYLRFDLSSLSTENTIISATLRLYHVASRDYEGATRTVNFYRVTSNWDETSLTWNDRPSHAETIGSKSLLHGNYGWFSMDLTNQVKNWVSGNQPNYGLVAIGPEHTFGIYRAFVATNNQYVGTPELHISYIPAPPPVLDAWPGNLSARAASTVAEGAASLNVGNVTYGTLAWTASIVGTPSSWLTLNQTGGSATPTNPGTVTFSVDATGLTPGTYTEQIQISSGTPDVENTPLITTFTLEVLDSLNTVYLPAVIGGGGSSSVAPQTVAVIVGVADYYYLGSAPNSGNLTDEWGYDLNEPVHDATKMANLAQTYWNVQPEDLTQLTDSSANRDDIMAALTAAAGKMCPGTTASAAATQAVCPNTRFIFYYSGHGGQTLDDNSDESDGYDEFIAAYDTNVVSGTFTSIITDDDLEEMLAAIPAEQIVVIIDSCYSGSMVTTTTAETETGATLLRRGLVNPYQPDTPAETNALSELAAPNRLVITGGTGDELTWESGELEDGVFTYFLMQGVTDSLNDANGNGRISAEEAYWFSHDLVDDWVFKNTGDHQNPAIYDQIWGQIDLTAVP